MVADQRNAQSYWMNGYSGASSFPLLVFLRALGFVSGSFAWAAMRAVNVITLMRPFAALVADVAAAAASCCLVR